MDFIDIEHEVINPNNGWNRCNITKGRLLIINEISNYKISTIENETEVMVRKALSRLVGKKFKAIALAFTWFALCLGSAFLIM